MYPAKPGLIVGFHGCDKTLRDEIVKGKTSLEISNNLYDWLGNGIYFWENNQQRALEFAKELFIPTMHCKWSNGFPVGIIPSNISTQSFGLLMK